MKARPSRSAGERALPDWLAKLLAAPPDAGMGIHRWLYRCACGLVPWRSPEASRSILSAAATRCSRPVPRREIDDAIKNARCDWHPDGLSRGLRLMLHQRCVPTAGRWPEPDWAAIRCIATSGAGLADLWECSPYRLEGRDTAGDFLSQLFPGNPWLCLAKAQPADARTARRLAWGNPAGHALIVPSPMTAAAGKRQDGKTSLRCLDNTAPRRFLIVEFDFKRATDAQAHGEVDDLLAALVDEPNIRTAPDLCAALLLHLAAQGAPLVLGVHSGGKSVHGWFGTHGASDEALRPFFAEACRLGADPATWTRCQLVRLPEGTRDNGRRQLVYYFDPAALPTA